MPHLSRLIASVAPLALAACAVANPNLPHPEVPTTAQAPFIGSGLAGVAAGETRDDWWRLYNDPALDGLVQQALAANKDVAVAIANVDLARASLRGSRSQRLPQTGISAGAQ